MQAPVAILILPTVLAGFLLFGRPSAWHRFFGLQFGAESIVSPASSEIVSTVLIFFIVVAGIVLAYLRYGWAPAVADASRRITFETLHTSAVLRNAFYVDAAIDALFVRPANRLGSFFGRWFDPQVIDGTVREAVISVRWLGSLFRSFQTGLLRSYALIIVFGVACFVAYYAFGTVR